MYQYKVDTVMEGWLGNMLVGASKVPVKKMEQRLNELAAQGWEVIFQVIESRRFLLFWTRECVILTLRRPIGGAPQPA